MGVLGVQSHGVVKRVYQTGVGPVVMIALSPVMALPFDVDNLTVPDDKRLAVAGHVLERAVTFSDRPRGTAFWFQWAC